MNIQRTLTFLFALLISMAAAAHDIEVANSDGVTIYYTYINNNSELEVSYRGTSYSAYSDEYSGRVVIPSSVYYNGKTYPVTSIGSSAFEDCSGLTSINIPNSVTSIKRNAFDGTAWYNNQPNGLVYAGKVAYEYKGTMPSNTSIVLKEGTKGIADDAFSYCSSLTSVTIPNSVTNIGIYAFYNCSGLTSINIPNSVTSIGSSAFYNCSSLTSINIPNSVTSIGSYAFRGCSGLTSVTIPNSVTSIEYGAFNGCSSLTSVTIPNSVTSIKSYAFLECGGLTSATIPNSVTSIEYSAFRDCSGLTSITIPNSVTIIWSNAFRNCESLVDCYCYAKSIPSTSSDSFDSIPISSATLHVPASAIDAYRATAPWSGFGTIVPIEEELADDLQDYLDSFADTEDVLTETTYTRTFNNTQWQALYVPFSLSYSQWSTLFEVARLTGATTEGDNTQIEATLLTADDGELLANTPYLIRAKNTGRYTLNVDASKMADKTETTKVLDQLIAIKGSYSPRTSLRTNGYRCMLGGSLWYPNDSYTLPPYRWYAYPVRLRIVRNISVQIAEGATTAISQQSVCDDDEQTSNRAVYDLSGRHVGNADAVSRLPKGIYITNGKKVINK